ncbi:MAG TPA: serine hydrolase domain-containing protein [Clostridia bacterium]|nr:serine hydrolase domain-containing protein [Clostridia bacterium]
MRSIWILCLILPVMNLTCAAEGEPKPIPRDGDPRLAEALAPIRERHKVPAIAAAIVTSKGLQSAASAGWRKAGTQIGVTADDLWHLGSDTKAMTATLVGVLVERGLMRWDMTVGEVFSKHGAEFASATNITVSMLLMHRAGLQPNLTWHKFKGSIREQRLAATREGLAKVTAATRSGYEYSNLGYVIVGAMIEQVTGSTWEQVMQRDLFRPLNMTNTGFGGMGTPGKIDQPWGHTAKAKPVAANGESMDNPPVLGPAGRVHSTMGDWAKFIADQLRGARGQRALLKPETYKRIQTPVAGAEYALGWLVTQRPWGLPPGLRGPESPQTATVLNHCGCNTMHYANVWLAPERDLALLVCVNQGDDTAFEATDAAIAAMLKLCDAKPE